MRVNRQPSPRVSVIAMIFAIAALPVLADEAADRAALTHACDALIARAVKRPYGWAWADTAPDAKAKGGAQPVTLKPAGTAAAGFALYWAGDLLDNPAYKEAALQAARGLAAAQRPTGAVPAHPIFLPNLPGGRDDVALVADRTPTCAAEALLLTIVEETGGKDPALRGSALRGLNWLLHQQTASGSWPQADPPATQPADAVRLLRLDDGEWRNCTLTLLLARDVLEDIRCAKAVERSNDLLLRLRLTNASPKAHALWATAYGMNLVPSDRLGDYPPGVDVVASRDAMQTLLATVLTLGEGRPTADETPTPARALVAAATALDKLPKYEGGVLRIYDFDVDATPTPPTGKPIGLERIGQLPPPNLRTGTWGLDRAIGHATDLKIHGRDAVVHAFATSDLTLHQRFAATMCGLSEDPFASAADDASVVNDPNGNTADRVREVWRLVRAIKAASKR